MAGKKETFADIVRAEGFGLPPKQDANTAVNHDDGKIVQAKQTAELAKENVAEFLSKNRIGRNKQGRSEPRSSKAAVFDDGRKYTADGVDRRRLDQLCREKTRCATIDLHGHTAVQACELLSEKILMMQSKGEQFLEVVHGRGLHSNAGPVLRDSVREWLRQESAVLGYAEMPLNPGASRVLLRRIR